MPSYAYPTADELQPTEEELKASRDAAGAQGTDAAIGSGVGTAAGGLLGALGLLVPGLAAVTIPAGLAAGGAIGGTIGNLVGSDTANKAEDTLSKDELERQKKLTAFQLRNEALQRLENTG